MSELRASFLKHLDKAPQDIIKSNLIWNKRAEEFFTMQITGEDDAFLDFFIKNADINGKKILDVGCGAGRYLVKLLEKGAIAEGLEPSEEMVKYCKKRLIESGFDPETKIYNCSFQEFDAQDGSYDYLFFSNSPAIYYYENYMKVLKLARKGIIASSWLHREDYLFAEISDNLGEKELVFGGEDLIYIANLLSIDGYFPSFISDISNIEEETDPKLLFKRYSHWFYGPVFTEDQEAKMIDEILKHINSNGKVIQKRLNVKGMLFCDFTVKK